MTLQFNDENPDFPRITRYLLLVYIAKTFRYLDHMEKKWIIQFILVCTDWARLQSHEEIWTLPSTQSL